MPTDRIPSASHSGADSKKLTHRAQASLIANCSAMTRRRGESHLQRVQVSCHGHKVRGFATKCLQPWFRPIPSDINDASRRPHAIPSSQLCETLERKVRVQNYGSMHIELSWRLCANVRSDVCCQILCMVAACFYTFCFLHLKNAMHMQCDSTTISMHMLAEAAVM